MNSGGLIGRQIGSYRVTALLGAGGMGEVYLAEDSILHRKVALKFVAGSFAEDDLARKRLLSEARAAAALDHPFICKVYETGQTEDKPFIAMEYVEGTTLRDRAGAGNFSVGEALRITGEIAEALGYAHKRGIVHRDLKPSNILLTEDGHVKVMDFGLAKRIVSDTNGFASTRTVTAPADRLAGTPAYMSPEQVRGEQLDPRSDIFALGIVLYEMITGTHPFSRSSSIETLHAILTESPQPIVRLVPKLPVRLESIVGRLLAKEKHQRYETLEQLRIDLADVAATLDELHSSMSRFRVRVAAMVTLVVVAAAAAGIWYMNRGSGGTVGIRDVGRWAASLFSDDVIAFAERDWLLVARFGNHTTDPVFDQSLDTAFAVAMGQSSYVNLLPASRIEGALRRMKVPAGQRIDGAIARQIALREGLKVVLVPRVTEVGGVYQLSGSIEDPATGAVLRSRVVRVRRKEDVLHGIDELVGEIRNDLGEARHSISQQGKPLAEVTTSSLEALKVFSRAREAHVATRTDEALVLLEEALRLDPSFTAARAQLGMIHFELRDREYGTKLLAQAIENIDGLTDREKYSVLAFHATAVEKNPQKAADYCTALLALYPDAAFAHNNLGRAYFHMSRWEDAIKSFRLALSIEPDLMLTYNSLNQIYLYQLGDLDAAIALARQQLTLTDQNHFPYDHLGWAFLGKGDLPQAREAFEMALTINPRATLDLYRLGHTYRLEGRYGDARETFLKIPAIDPSESSAFYDAGVVSQLMGDEAAARSYFLRCRRLIEQLIRDDPKNASNHLDLAVVLARLHADADPAADRAIALDPNLHFEYAVLLSVQGRRDEAIRHLQLAVEKGFRNFVWMKIHVDLEPLSTDSRFQKLITENLKS